MPAPGEIAHKSRIDLVELELVRTIEPGEPLYSDVPGESNITVLTVGVQVEIYRDNGALYWTTTDAINKNIPLLVGTPGKQNKMPAWLANAVYVENNG